VYGQIGQAARVHAAAQGVRGYRRIWMVQSSEDHGIGVRSYV